MKYLLLIPLFMALSAHAGDYKEPEVVYVETVERVETFEYIETTETVYVQNKELDSIAAISAAMSSIPGISHANTHKHSDSGSHTAIGFGAGHYRDSNAISAALEHHKDNTAIQFIVSKSSDTSTAFGVGFTYQY